MFYVLRELIFAIRTDWFSCWELIFAIFRKYPVLSIDNIFVFIEYLQLRYLFSNHKLVFHFMPFCFCMKRTSGDCTDTIS